MAMIKESVNGAIEGLKLFKTELKDNWKGAADSAIAEITRIAEAINEVKSISLGSMSANIMASVVGKASGENQSANSAKTVDYTSQLNLSNDYLNKISNNTAKTNVLLGTLINETIKGRVVRTKMTLTSNGGIE